MTKTIKSVLAIIHDKDNFLILKKKGIWVGWQFVQGGIDEGETEEKAVLREVKEETGLIGEIEKKLDIKTDYWFVWEKEKVHKLVQFFLIKADSKEKVILSVEYSDFKWCGYEEALKNLKFNKKEFEKIYKEWRIK